MKMEVGARILTVCDELDTIFPKLQEAIAEIDDTEERRAMMRGLGELIASLVEGIQLPVFRALPELNPLRRGEG